LAKNHDAMLEFGYATAYIVCDRGVTHELVRHRLASFAQESTRYCNYSKDKFDNEVSFIEPPFGDNTIAREQWVYACELAESFYLDILKCGTSPQIARSVLPTCLKTEITVGANLREWRHIFKMRCATSAHPQMRELMLPALYIFYKKIPYLYKDLYEQFIGMPDLSPKI
jgi:thymidylate synthase (FAD)